MHSSRNGLSTVLRGVSDLETFVAEFEQAVAQSGCSLDERFLPPSDHPQRLEIEEELVRIDLELSRERGDSRPLEAYRRLVPDVFASPARLASVAFEEYRLRRDAGEAVSWQEYLDDYNLPPESWPKSIAMHPSAAAIPKFPSVGERFAGMDLESLLGRGAFSQVYLTRQSEFGNRMVALKITSQRSIEPERLGRLQHTNIVPVYSAHYDQGRLGICMPFLGGMTLADLELPLSWREAAVCAAQLADGLAHAHRRDVVHSDIKPANVLVGDDGIPRLLDFNLATRSVAADETVFVGGTLPYMAPEHIEAVLVGRAPPPQSDLFALGVILYQMLTGQLPFETRSGNLEHVAAQLVDDRTTADVSPRVFNSAVPPGLDAIVRKCLESDLSLRYEDAADIAEDIRLEIADRPLKHASEPWSAARIGKWRRRNKTHLTQWGLALACIVAIVAGGIFWDRSQHLAANTALHRFERLALEARTLLCVPDADADLLARGEELASSALAEFDGRSAGRLSRLDSIDRNRVLATVAELRIMIDNAAVRTGKAHEKQRVATAFATPETATLTSAKLMSEHKFGEAEKVLSEALSRRSGDPVLWIQLGVAQMAAGEAPLAMESLTAAVALQPKSAVAWRYRGHARRDAGQLEEALADFDRAARLTAPSPSLELNRALTLMDLRRFIEAEEAVSLALKLGADWPRAWLLRARIRERQDNKSGAEADRRTAALRQPIDADDWAALAVSCERDDPGRALEYIEQGLSRFPTSLVLLRNQIHLLGDVLKQPQQALASADRILQYYPGDVRAQLSRAVILAHAGHSTQAAETCQQIDSERLRAIDQLQLACVYALCIENDVTATDKSLHRLQLALAGEPSLALRAAHDKDFAPLKDHPQFRRLIGGAVALVQPVPSSQSTPSN